MRITAIGCAGVLFFGGLALAQTAPEALPLDLAFSQKQVRRSDSPVVTADGRWLAYEVYTPPIRRSNAAPRPGEGVRIFIASTEGGKAQAVCREAADSWRPSWSPDGRLLAFYSNEGGMPQLWVYDVVKAEARRVSDRRIKARLWPMDKPAWNTDGREVFVPIDLAPHPEPAAGTSVSQESPRFAVYTTDGEKQGSAVSDTDAFQQYLMGENNATLAAVNLNSGDVRVLVSAESEPRPSLLQVSPDGRWVSYMSVFKLDPGKGMQTYFDLALVPAGGGDRIVVETDLETTNRIYWGEPYLWTKDGRHLVFTKGRRLWIADVSATGAGKPRLLDAKLGDLNEAPFALTRDSRAILVGLAPAGDQAYDSVASQSMAIVPLDGSATKLLRVQGWPVMANAETLWQPETSAIHFIVNDEKTAERSVLRFDLRTDAVKTVWRGRGRITIAGAGPGDSLIARFEDVQTAPDFFRFSGAFDRMDRLTRIEPVLEHITIGRMETFSTTIPGFDGRQMAVHSAVFLPPGAGRGSRLPTIVYFYSGAPFSEYAQDFGGGAPNTIPVQIFATRGYAVLFADVPMGPMGKGGNPLEEMADAMMPQVYRAAELGYTDIGRVAIMGHSYGGYSAAGMVTRTNLFRAAIAIDGTYDLPGDYGSMTRGGVAYNSQWFEAGQARMGTHPWADLKRYLANSPYYLADRIHTPLLLIHGRSDDTCPPQEAEKMFNALKRLESTAQLVIYEGEGHSPSEWSRANAVDAAERILAFLQRHMQEPEGTRK
jgi:dipeptidyl aminopeptidase/acylaminoacyl peptidase